jgi:diadenosine tetraphosphate (Ap4A) HIT family hydrolase
VGGLLVVRTERFRVVRVQDAQFPAYYRLIWNEHVPEWTDLTPLHQGECMHAVAAIEAVLRSELQPAKVNLASFGNVVPHLHWHVMARFDWDTHYPEPYWGKLQRPANEDKLQDLTDRMPEVDAALALAI